MNTERLFKWEVINKAGVVTGHVYAPDKDHAWAITQQSWYRDDVSEVRRVTTT